MRVRAPAKVRGGLQFTCLRNTFLDESFLLLILNQASAFAIGCAGIQAIRLDRSLLTVQKALPYLNDRASIILVASAGKNRGFPGRSTYSATKAALMSFARTWTSEFKDRKIRTNVLSPGPVDTPMFDEQFPSKEGAAEARKQITAMTPLARLARPEEIASAALFLASDQSSYVAGIDLPVDGGLTAV